MAGNLIRKHSVSIRGHRTSITLENAFMDALRQMADQRGLALAALISEIDAAQAAPGNLSSALRLAVLDWALNSPDARSRNSDCPTPTD